MTLLTLVWRHIVEFICKIKIPLIVLLREKLLQFDWLRAVVFQLNS